MQLLEFQAKEIFREYGISLLDSIASTNIEEGRKHAKQLGYPFVIKIQVPVGGRGKAGGIQKCQNDDEFDIKYPQVMDLEIKGEKARAIEIESVKTQIIKEVGLGDVSDKVAKEVAKEMGLEGITAEGVVDTLKKLSKLTIEKEAELVEINPLAIMQDDTVMALDGKFVTDDNANFRHDELQKYQEKTEIEEQAEKSGFSLVELDGDIAVVGNGAGLVMSTLDMLSDNGGKPACFLDVGGGATTESVYEALTLISKLDRVKGILVNLYGGIVKTTVVAEAFLKAYENNLIDIPVFSRLKGTESEKAKEMLQGSRTNIFDSVEEAINAAVMGVKK
jgi:succinyl-CoA synthetase beta subunit